MFTPRSSGVLLHPTSLASPFGVGDIGDEAYQFVDWLADSGQRWWQILPMNPSLGDGSPYMSPSAFAGNPVLVSPGFLQQQGLLASEDLDRLPQNSGTIDFDSVMASRGVMLRQAYTRFQASPGDLVDSFDQFRAAHGYWLVDHCEFMAAREANGERDWQTWSEYVDPATRRLTEAGRRALADRIAYYAFEQFLFDHQWRSLRAYADKRGVRIIGDLPIYVATNSADVWANRDIFRLDEAGRPTEVAGVPPDYFAETGQLWSNPIYNWEVLEQRGFDWWTKRVRRTLEQVDVARIDHFRGFEAYWSVPAGETTAINGRWVPGPREKLFEKIAHSVGGDAHSLPLIAEDLGVITDEVTALRKSFGLPGMRVLQFEFLNPDERRWRVEEYESDSAVYTGTHDNDTTVGWFQGEIVPDHHRMERLRHLTSANVERICPEMIEIAWKSSGNLAIVPVQDILALGSEARMNVPGTAWPARPNWRWRLASGALTKAHAGSLAELTDRYGRRV